MCSTLLEEAAKLGNPKWVYAVGGIIFFLSFAGDFHLF
jgi:hypothetical protein